MYHHYFIRTAFTFYVQVEYHIFVEFKNTLRLQNVVFKEYERSSEWGVAYFLDID